MLYLNDPRNPVDPPARMIRVWNVKTNMSGNPDYDAPSSENSLAVLTGEFGGALPSLWRLERNVFEDSHEEVLWISVGGRGMEGTCPMPVGTRIIQIWNAETGECGLPKSSTSPILINGETGSDLGGYNARSVILPGR